MFGLQGLADPNGVYLLENYGLLLVVLAVGSTPLVAKVGAALKARLPEKAWFVEAIFYTLVFFVSVVYLSAAAYNPFLYFRF